MATITRGGASRWRNEHRTIELAMNRTAHLNQTAGSDCAGDLAARQNVLTAFLAEELSAGNPLAAMGSGWSQSELYPGQATLLDTGGDQAIWALPDEAFSDGARNPHRFVMVTGGTKVSRLMTWLGARAPPLSLSTAGSHKGQSVAGMLATGSHGSMLAQSGFEGHVRGVLLATGPGEATWLEAEPILDRDYVARFAKPGDPALFLAALVHLGGMGIVSAVLLEVEEEFRLGRVKRTRVLPGKWARQCADGDFTAATGSARRPDYYEVTLDPFRGAAHEGLETLWFRNPGLPLVEALDPGETGILDLIVEVATKAANDKAGLMLDPAGSPEALPIDVPKMTWDEFRTNAVDEPEAHYRLSQLIADWKPHTLFGWLRVDVYNAAFAVPLERLPEALEIGFAMGAEASRFERHYVYTVRFAQRSPADMGFLRFENNAIINIDGLSKNVWGSTSHRAARELARRFAAAGLPFSMHWGKDAPSDADKIARDFGVPMKRFMAARAALLGANSSCFTSPALERWGLA